MKQTSEITFNDISRSNFGSYIRVVYNGKLVYDDADDCLYIDGKLAECNVTDAIENFLKKYGEKHIYNFYCNVTQFHHTELYVVGE